MSFSFLVSCEIQINTRGPKALQVFCFSKPEEEEAPPGHQAPRTASPMVTARQTHLQPKQPHLRKAPSEKGARPQLGWAARVFPSPLLKNTLNHPL